MNRWAVLGYLKARWIIAGILVMLPTAGQATRWVLISSIPSAARYIDADAIVFDDATATIWLKTDYTTTGAKGEKQAMEKWMHDCATQRSKLLALTLYKADGRVIGSAEVPRYRMEWMPIVPGSAGETVHERICSILNGPIEQRDPERIVFETA